MDETRQPPQSNATPTQTNAAPMRPAPNAPVVDAARIALMMAAVKAGFVHVLWWPELAPLTDKERAIVREQVFLAARGRAWSAA